MLKLDSLELIGFKSFAERTRIRFGEGITCVVGPNGCGKSNFADAVGWSLGAHSAYSLRGSKMEDVIFAGTRKRKPFGLAESNLVFSQPENKANVVDGMEISGENLEISRKLYRSGESVYYINRRRSRLKDVHEVLEKGGLGFASYALIAQGKIEWFLNAKPLDRRAVIEEAARITGYKSRRRSAELKLEMAQQNLLRLNDVITEIERQLRSLKRKAGKALRYSEAKESFRKVLGQKILLQAKELKGQLQQSGEKLKDHREQEAGLQKELRKQEKAHQGTLQRREELDVDLSRLKEILSELQLELDRTENSIRHHEEQIGSTRRSLEANRSERTVIEQSLKKLASELSRFQSEQSVLADQGVRVEADVRKQAELVERYRSDMEREENRLEELRNQLVRLTADSASLKNLKEQLKQKLKTAESVCERLEKERSQYVLRLEESTFRLEEATRNLDQKRSLLLQMSQELSDQAKKKRELETEVSEFKAQAEEMQSRLIAQRERLHSLQEIELSHSQYSEGVQNFLKHLHGNQTVRTGGTLADFIQTSPEFERLVEEVLNQELEYILVDSLDAAVEGISELKTVDGGKCTFLSLSNGYKHTNGNGSGSNNGYNQAVDFAAQDGVYGKLSDLLTMKPDVKKAFQRTLPQRAEAVVVSDLGRAFELAAQYSDTVFMTLEGESLTPSGLLSASSSQAKKLGLLSLKRQKRELETRITGAQKEFSQARDQEEKQSERLRMASQIFDEKKESLLGLEKEIISLTHQHEQWKSEAQRHKQTLRVVDAELSQLTSEREENRENIRQVEDQLDEKNSSRAASDRLLIQSQQMLQQPKGEYTSIQEQMHLVFSEHKVLEERCLALERTLERVEEQREGLEARKESMETAYSQHEEQLMRMESILTTLRENSDKYRTDERTVALDLEGREQEQAIWKQDYPKHEELLLNLRETKSDMQEQRAELDVERARLETQLQNLNQQCFEQLQVTLEQAAANMDLEEVVLEKVLEQFEELRTKLDKFGPINMAALEEFQENEERYAFLCSQRQDVEASIVDTNRAIQEINRRSRQQFSEAFEAINLHFKEIFQKLFEGGECGMRLLDEDDILESGVDIFAQPPGKKLQNVMLLSGGEKALTVFALLMAIFRFRPSRFCVLDEVDAPLDDSNVTRFTKLIRQMSKEIQFIIISHNKLTMEIADTLFGVTMEEPGVSQIVSVEF